MRLILNVKDLGRSLLSVFHSFIKLFSFVCIDCAACCNTVIITNIIAALSTSLAHSLTFGPSYLHLYTQHTLWCSGPCHQTTPTHTSSSGYDKWTPPWRVNNKVIQPQPYQSLSLSGKKRVIGYM